MPEQRKQRMRLQPSAMRWLTRTRWLVATTLLLTGAAIAMGPVSWPRDAWPAFTTLGVIMFLYNLIIWCIEQRLQRHLQAVSSAPLYASAVALDLVVIAIIASLTGGAKSPFNVLFAAHIALGANLLRPRASMLIASASVVLLVLVSLALQPVAQLRADALVYVGLAASLGAIAFVTAHLTRALQTERVATLTEELREQAILQTLVDGVITIDQHGVILAVNPAVERIFGYSKQELIGENISCLMHEPEQSEHDQYVAKYLRTGEARIIGIGREVLARRKDGATVPIDLAVSRVDLPDGAVFTGILRDITTRKEAETELCAINEELKRHQQALVQQEKMAAMGQMAAGVAHEVSNPLAAIDSLLQLARRRKKPLDDKGMLTVQMQIDRMRQLLRQIATFAHPGDTNIEIISFNDVVEQSLTLLGFDSRMKTVDLRCDLSPDVGLVRASAQGLQQVVVNLAQNALDAICDATDPTLRVRTYQRDHECVLELADNGPGVPPDIADRIFDPFFTTKPVGEGTGLGLAISASVVQRFGGTIAFAPGPNGGCAFSVTLPLALGSNDREDGDSAVPTFKNGACPRSADN